MGRPSFFFVQDEPTSDKPLKPATVCSTDSDGEINPARHQRPIKGQIFR